MAHQLRNSSQSVGSPRLDAPLFWAINNDLERSSNNVAAVWFSMVYDCAGTRFQLHFGWLRGEVTRLHVEAYFPFWSPPYVCLQTHFRVLEAYISLSHTIKKSPLLYGCFSCPGGGVRYLYHAEPAFFPSAIPGKSPNPFLSTSRLYHSVALHCVKMGLLWACLLRWFIKGHKLPRFFSSPGCLIFSKTNFLTRGTNQLLSQNRPNWLTVAANHSFIQSGCVGDISGIVWIIAK